MQKSSIKPIDRAAPDPGFLAHAPEILIFSTCLGLVQELLSLKRSGGGGCETLTQDLTVLLFRLTRTAEATHRFDIVEPVAALGQFSPSFWRWFNWWNDYRKTLTPASIDYIEGLARDGKSALNNHRPKGDWAQCRATAAFGLEVI